jgi:predicted O-linked N-acetylglucosamine transferase (SPINDLY family)
MCFVLAHVGRTAEALMYAERAAAAAPEHPHVLTNLGSALMNLGRLDEAVDVLRRAVSFEGVGTRARHALAMTLNVAKRYGESVDVAREGLERAVMDPALSMDLASSYVGLARADLAAKTLRGMLSWYPDQPNAVGNLATMLNYVPGLDPLVIRQAHVAYGEILGRFLPPARPPAISDPDPDRVVRLGIIIPDLVSNAVAQFIRPLLENLDESRFELFVYYTSPAEKVEPSWPGMVAHTARRVPWHTEAQLDPVLRGDRLDILMDLVGMTTHHRLPSLHMKPAPIQVTYAGYPNTTGIRAIDYRVVDSITDPVGAERLSVEHLVRLDPCFLCFVAPDAAPEPSRTRGRPITFGSFNHLPKINDSLLRLWVRVVDAVPGSRIVIKAEALSRAETRAAVLERAVAAGLEASRVDVRPPTPTRAEHLAMYSEIDVALDTFPYHGTTTTCEAMYMGVPVVTLAGNSHVSRVGVSLLTNAGMGENVAGAEDEYVRIAAGLAGDATKLDSLRAGLRAKMVASPLCDASAFATRFQTALRTMWRERCARG